MSAVNRSTEFRSDIEGLRAVAVLLVVACHCGIWWCSGGFVGVDVFFVLSGYLITGLLVAEVRSTTRVSLPRFYARRARRLLPASALVLLVTLAGAAAVLTPQELTFTGRAARAAALYVSNVFFDHDAADYFASRAESNPLLHTWTLAVEEQFYLIWPTLVILGLQVARSRKALVTILTALTLLSFCVCLWGTARAATFAFYELPARAWEFGIGGLLALGSFHTSKPRPILWTTVGWLGALAILASGYLIPPGSGFPGWLATIPVFGAGAALIAGAELPHRGVGFVLDSRPMQYLGARSYSWYLWHWPFLLFAAALLPELSVAGKIAAAVGSLAAATLTFRFVERPVRGSTYMQARPGLSLCLAGAATIVTVALAFAAMRMGYRLADEPQFRPITAAIADIAHMPRDKCVGLGRSSEVITCSFGREASSVTVVLFGDSHAIQWFDAMDLLASAEGWGLVTFVKSGCPAIDIPSGPPAGTDTCRKWRSEAIRQIVALRPAAVFVASFTAYFGRAVYRDPERSLEVLRLGTRRTLEQLDAAGLRVIEFRDTPLPSFDVPICLARSVLHSWLATGRCDLAVSSSVYPSVFEAEKAAARGLALVHFLDLTDLICRGVVCPATYDKMIVYRDDGHITGTFARSLAPDIGSRVMPWIQGD